MGNYEFIWDGEFEWPHLQLRVPFDRCGEYYYPRINKQIIKYFFMKSCLKAGLDKKTLKDYCFEGKLLDESPYVDWFSDSGLSFTISTVNDKEEVVLLSTIDGLAFYSRRIEFRKGQIQ